MGYRKGAFWERSLKKLLEEKGFFVVRASGSGCDGSSPDLIVLRSTKKFALECKAWDSAYLNIDAFKLQLMQAWEKHTGMPVYIAWKTPRKEWKFFPLNALREAGKNFGLNKTDLETGIEFEELIK